MKRFLFTATALSLILPATVHAKTWGEITFSPRESWWDAELQDYLLGDSYEVIISNPDTPGLKKSLAISCQFIDLGDGAPIFYYSTSLVFEGTAASVLPVTTTDQDDFDNRDRFEIRFSTPSSTTHEYWEWTKYEEDYIGGMPAVDVDTALTYNDLRNADWVEVETMGQTFLLDLTLVQGYLQGFDRKCGEL